MKNETNKKDMILWQEVRRCDFFEGDVRRIRAQFGIPTGGSGENGFLRPVVDRRYFRETKALAAKCMDELKRNHKITTDPFPLTLELLIDFYIQDGPKHVDRIIREQRNPFGCGLIVDIANFTREQLRYFKGKMVIVIEPHASRDDVVNFVIRRWRMIKHFSSSVPRIRKPTAIERHDFIRDMCKLSKAELCERLNLRNSDVVGKTRYEVIAEQMGPNLGSKMVEEICKGYKKNRR
jgi:hypothetical protein